MKICITRKLYIQYLIIMLVSVGIVLFLASLYNYLGYNFKLLFKIIYIHIILEIIFMFYILIKIKKKEINNMSDEREYFIVSKSAAITGVVSISLTPVLILFILIIPNYLSHATFIYILILENITIYI